MIRVTTIYAASAGASARYYTGYLTKDTGELPGRWTGRQASAFGLGREVSTEALESLLSGRHPITGQVLGRELLDRSDRHGNVTKVVAGYDATFSAPKSVSVLWALTGDDGLAGCHDRAVAAAVAMIEKYGSTTRIRSNGTRLHPDTGGLTPNSADDHHGCATPLHDLARDRHGSAGRHAWCPTNSSSVMS